MTRRLGRGVVVALLLLVLVAAACAPPDGDGDAGPDGEVPENCTVVDVATSPEKLELLTQLAEEFNGSDAADEGGCTFVRVQRKSSGVGARLLAEGWDESTEGPRPVIWSPSASSWGAVVNQLSLIHI